MQLVGYLYIIIILCLRPKIRNGRMLNKQGKGGLMVNGSSKISMQIQYWQPILLKGNHSLSVEVAYTSVSVVAHVASNPVHEADLLQWSPK